jgi:hypothetical protein
MVERGVKMIQPDSWGLAGSRKAGAKAGQGPDAVYVLQMGATRVCTCRRARYSRQVSRLVRRWQQTDRPSHRI